MSSSGAGMRARRLGAFVATVLIAFPIAFGGWYLYSRNVGGSIAVGLLTACTGGALAALRSA